MIIIVESCLNDRFCLTVIALTATLTVTVLEVRLAYFACRLLHHYHTDQSSSILTTKYVSIHASSSTLLADPDSQNFKDTIQRELQKISAFFIEKEAELEVKPFLSSIFLPVFLGTQACH